MDHNVVGGGPAGDRTYMPGHHIEGGRMTPIVEEEGRISSRTTTDHSKNGEMYLDEFHLGAVREAFPDADVRTMTDLFREYPTEVGEIARIAATDMPHLFRRTVSPDGRPERDDQRSVELAKAGDVVWLLEDPRAEQRASIPPNEVNIVTIFAIEAMRTDRDDQIHVSGPAMAKYITQMGGELDELYGRVKQQSSFGDRLPDILRVDMVAATDARFAVPAHDAAELDEVWAAYERYEAEMAEMAALKADFFRGGGQAGSEEGRELLGRATSTKDRVVGEVVARLELLPRLLNDAGEHGDFATQYDTLVAEEGLYVPAYVTETSFARMTEITADMRKLAKRGGK